MIETKSRFSSNETGKESVIINVHNKSNWTDEQAANGFFHHAGLPASHGIGDSRVEQVVRSWRAHGHHEARQSVECTEEGRVSMDVPSSKCAPQEALKDVERHTELLRWLEGRQGHWQAGFKSKHRSRQSWRVLQWHDESWFIVGWIPNVGKVRLKRKGYIPTDQRIRPMTISERAGPMVRVSQRPSGNAEPDTGHG
jgi:hypothetical protein